MFLDYIIIYTEQAPSVSLCMSILHLHSDQQQCGQQMLKMCDYLSEFLQPVSPGLPNPEVDYALIIRLVCKFNLLTTELCVLQKHFKWVHIYKMFCLFSHFKMF